MEAKIVKRTDILLLVFFSFILVGCERPAQIEDVEGTYEASYDGTYQKIKLQPGGTYKYEVLEDGKHYEHRDSWSVRGKSDGCLNIKIDEYNDRIRSKIDGDETSSNFDTPAYEIKCVNSVLFKEGTFIDIDRDNGVFYKKVADQ
jgi:hypothetical protein